VTPTESREVVLGLSRERLARATTRFERLARDAAERIHHLRQEKQTLERRLADVEALSTQERQNFEQRISVLTSVASESEERATAFTDLNARLANQERMLNDHIETIARLESEHATRTSQLKEQQEVETLWQSELEEWKSKTAQLEERIGKIGKERDAFRTRIFEDERVNAQYALKLTQEDRDNAAKAIESLIDQFAAMESRVLAAEEK
jgi:DNA repair exonuclease SbcCD ATPase subunit